MVADTEETCARVLEIAREQANVDWKAEQRREFQAHVMVAFALGRQIPLDVGPVGVRVASVAGSLLEVGVVRGHNGRRQRRKQDAGDDQQYRMAISHDRGASQVAIFLSILF